MLSRQFLVSFNLVFLVVTAQVLNADDCDWSIVSSTEEERADVSGELTLEELEVSLARFDKCLNQQKNSEQQAQNAASAAAAIERAAQQAGTNASPSDSTSSDTSESGQASGSPQRTTNSSQNEQTNQQGTETTTSANSRIGSSPTSMQKGRNPTAATVDPNGGGSNRNLVEDDVARLLREAAEKEQDPELKKELWEQYNAYMDNL